MPLAFAPSQRGGSWRRRARWIGVPVVLGACLGGCANGSTSATAPGGRISVVAAENFWGSIARQVGGDRVRVTSIITNPNTDPHDYEATAADGRAIAGAQLVIVNGIGYDPWAMGLVAANPASGRTVLDVGQLVGIAPGGNPHRWYDPADVHQIIGQITADYTRIAPGDASYFRLQEHVFLTRSLARYDSLIDDIRATYAGTPIGASESIVTPLAHALGLRMRTPESFLDAISEGNDPTAADKSTIDAQIAQKQITIYVYNTQNATPDVAAQVRAARARGIPIATVTETMTPAGASFQNWQGRELQGIESALARATGR